MRTANEILFVILSLFVLAFVLPHSFDLPTREDAKLWAIFVGLLLIPTIWLLAQSRKGNDTTSQNLRLVACLYNAAASLALFWFAATVPAETEQAFEEKFYSILITLLAVLNSAVLGSQLRRHRKA